MNATTLKNVYPLLKKHGFEECRIQSEFDNDLGIVIPLFKLVTLLEIVDKEDKEDKEKLPVEVLSEVFKKTEMMYPYKKPGNRDSYREYNRGWSDAIDHIASQLGVRY